MNTAFLRAGLLVPAFLAVQYLFAAPLVLAGPDAPSNTLTETEKAAGWKLLFDGKTTEGWRGYLQPTFPDQGWVAEDGWLKHRARGGGGDIITKAKFRNFDLEFDWRIGPKANTGVKYFVAEKGKSAIGHEYQIIDDVAQGYTLGDKHRTASYYDVLPLSTPLEPKPPGQFNHSRILVQGSHVEHWLNGTKVLDYELGSDAVKTAVARSKFRDVPGFGVGLEGHILLQDHGGEVGFCNVKLHELPAK